MASALELLSGPGKSLKKEPPDAKSDGAGCSATYERYVSRE